jgi:hypothetical protein
MPFAPLTSTTWTMLDGSRVFPAQFSGVCAVSGLPFGAGSEVRMATVNGVRGAVTQHGLRLLDVRYGADATDARSSFVLVTDAVDTDALVAGATRLTLLNKQGMRTVCKLENGCWWANGSRRTEKQMLAQARKAFAVAAERVG